MLKQEKQENVVRKSSGYPEYSYELWVKHSFVALDSQNMMQGGWTQTPHFGAGKLS